MYVCRYFRWVQTNALFQFENGAFFLWLGLPSTLIRHENGAFRKRSSEPEAFENAGFSFRLDGKHFENGAFRKVWHHDNHVISLLEITNFTTTISSLATWKKMYSFFLFFLYLQAFWISFTGFTSLCETYSLKASEESCGTDKLTSTLNTYLGKIVEGKWNRN